MQAQLSLIPDASPSFDGQTFDIEQDGKRLATQFEATRDLMQDGEWRNLAQIALALRKRGLHVTEASLSARLRDLRKPKFGAFRVERRRIVGGLFEYRVISRAICLLFALLSAHAENLPEAPIPQVHAADAARTSPIHGSWISRGELRDGFEIIAANYFDWQTTEHFLKHGGMEAILPDSLVRNNTGFFAFKVAESAGEIYAEHAVDRMHFTQRHRWFRYSAGIGVQAVVGFTVHTDIANYQYASSLHPSLPPVTPAPSSPKIFHAGGVK